MATLAKKYEHNFTVVNAKLIASLFHLNIATSRGLINKRDGKMKTTSLGNEIVYHCNPQHSIALSMEKFGVKNCEQAFFTVYVDFPHESMLELKTEVLEIAAEEITDLNKHVEFHDVDQTISLFDLKEGEKNTSNPNGILIAIYTKLALKNI